MSRVVLPNSVTPLLYELVLEPHIESCTFTADERIHLEIHEATNEIKFHAKDLEFHNIVFKDAEDEVEPQVEFLDDDIVRLEFPRLLNLGYALVSIQFTGQISDSLQGFYFSGEGASLILATQFAPIGARRCFPCFDEPNFKAIFRVTIVLDRDLQVVSNMPTESVIHLQKKRVEFMKTPKMSTYLVAFVIGKFDSTSRLSRDSVLVTAYSTEGNWRKLLFALDVTCRSLDIYNDFFGVNYPLPKLDILGVPDFAFAAMENWGLILFRELDLFCEDKVSMERKLKIASVAAHEVAHQWFGNLVTMQWWDDLWLNEGFASFMESLVVDKLFPEIRIWQNFVSRQQTALSLDCLPSSHAIEVPILRAHEAWEVFDSISYLKGANLVRMLNKFLGDENFREGLEKYMKQHALANTNTEDLLRCWDEVSGFDVGGLFQTWTKKKGHPLLRVSASGQKLTITQEWFLPVGEKDDVTWRIPFQVQLRRGSETRFCNFVMTQKEEEFELPLQIEGFDFIKVNYQHTVLCRTLHDKTLNEKLIQNFHELDVEDRIGYLSDSFALTKSGDISIPEFLEILDQAYSERNEYSCCLLDDILQQMERVFAYCGKTYFAEEVKEKFCVPLIQEVGWNENTYDSDSTKLLRSVATKIVARFANDDEEVVAKSYEMLKKKDPNTRQAVFTILAKHDFESLKEMHNSSTDASERRDLYVALANAKDPRRVLDWSLSTDIRKQDFLQGWLKTSLVGNSEVFDWFEERREEIEEKLRDVANNVFQNCVRFSAAGRMNLGFIERFESYWKNSERSKDCVRLVEQMSDEIRFNAKFLESVKNDS